MQPARFSVAPMMGRTDRHFRRMIRAFSRSAWLYTPMISAGAIVRGRAEDALRFDPVERPLVLQVGGSDPGMLAACAGVARDRGFDEINLNCGCPSPAARDGSYGARLMLDPSRVADCVAAMSTAGLPVTVKHRLGVDDVDDHESLLRFIDIVAAAGCRRFIVHARKALLSGLDPAQNRSIPPLRHEAVSQLVEQRPQLAFELNGGVTTLAQAHEVVARTPKLAGVMVGRAIAERPFAFAELDAVFGNAPGALDRDLPDVVARLVHYAEQECERGVPLIDVVRPLLGLSFGAAGGRAFRRRLSTANLRASNVVPLREAVAAWTGARHS